MMALQATRTVRLSIDDRASLSALLAETLEPRRTVQAILDTLPGGPAAALVTSMLREAGSWRAQLHQALRAAEDLGRLPLLLAAFTRCEAGLDAALWSAMPWLMCELTGGATASSGVGTLDPTAFVGDPQGRNCALVLAVCSQVGGGADERTVARVLRVPDEVVGQAADALVEHGFLVRRGARLCVTSSGAAAGTLVADAIPADGRRGLCQRMAGLPDSDSSARPVRGGFQGREDACVRAGLGQAAHARRRGHLDVSTWFARRAYALSSRDTAFRADGAVSRTLVDAVAAWTAAVFQAKDARAVQLLHDTMAARNDELGRGIAALCEGFAGWSRDTPEERYRRVSRLRFGHPLLEQQRMLVRMNTAALFERAGDSVATLDQLALEVQQAREEDEDCFAGEVAYLRACIAALRAYRQLDFEGCTRRWYEAFLCGADAVPKLSALHGAALAAIEADDLARALQLVGECERALAIMDSDLWFVRIALLRADVDWRSGLAPDGNSIDELWRLVARARRTSQPLLCCWSLVYLARLIWRDCLGPEGVTAPPVLDAVTERVRDLLLGHLDAAPNANTRAAMAALGELFQRHHDAAALFDRIGTSGALPPRLRLQIIVLSAIALGTLPDEWAREVDHLFVHPEVSHHAPGVRAELLSRAEIDACLHELGHRLRKEA